MLLGSSRIARSGGFDLDLAIQAEPEERAPDFAAAVGRVQCGIDQGNCILTNNRLKPGSRGRAARRPPAWTQEIGLKRRVHAGGRLAEGPQGRFQSRGI